MGLKLALCQYQAEIGNVSANLNRIMTTLSQTKSDVYIFPELFLTGYGADCSSLSEEVQYAVDRMRLWCLEMDVAILVGAPSYRSNGIRNSLLFISSGETVRYDKMYPARSGVCSEKGFMRGDKPMLCSFKGMTFGLSICYDIFFPEILRSYALAGADIDICIAASAIQTKPYYDRILPARSLENLFYTVFVNGIGVSGDQRFYGSSKLIGPLGNTISELGSEEEVRCVYVDKEVIINARKENKHLDDRRIDINWRLDSL